VQAVAVHPADGTFAAATSGGLVYRIRLADGGTVGEPIRYDGRPVSVAFSQDGKEVYVGGRPKPPGRAAFRRYNATTGQLLPVEPITPDGQLYALAVSPKDNAVATGGSLRELQIWDPAKRPDGGGKPLRHPGPVFALDFHPRKDLVASGCLDGSVRFWDTRTGTAAGPELQHRAPVRSLAYSADGGLLLSGSEDGTARLWDVSEPGHEGPVGQPLYHLSDIRCVAIDPKRERMLTVGYDRTARLWRISPGNPDVKVLRHHAAVSVVAFNSDDSQVLTGCRDSKVEGKRGEARLWSMADGKLVRNFPHGAEVLAAALRPGDESLVLTAGNDGLAKLWERDTGRLRQEWTHDGVIDTAAFQPDGVHIALAGQGSMVKIGTIGKGEEKLIDTRVRSWVWNVAFQPNGNLLLTDGAITPEGKHGARLWRVPGWELAHELVEHDNEVRGALFSRKGDKVLIYSYDGRASLWSTKDGNRTALLSGHTGQVSVGAFSADGRFVATGGADGTARIWDAETGALRSTLAHGGWVRALDFSDDGSTLATACDDGGVRLWHVPDGTTLGAILHHQGPVVCLAFRHKGQAVVSGSKDGTARIWTLPQPCEGSASDIKRQLEVDLGMQLQADGGIRILDGQNWRRRRDPGSPSS
jgi:WD40 repeat protein